MLFPDAVIKLLTPLTVNGTGIDQGPALHADADGRKRGTVTVSPIGVGESCKRSG
jgi:hypothetical protein